MTTDSQIVDLVEKARNNRTETDNVEFKDARGGIPGDLWKTISSFSHKPKGGIIVFGVKEDRDNNTIQIVGNLNLAILQEKIAELLSNVIRNHGTVNIKIFEYEKKQLLALVIDETPDEKKPCFNYTLGLPRGACIREGNTDRVITDEEMRAFIRNSSLYKFDKTQANGAELSMLDKEKIKGFLEKSAIKTKRDNLDNQPTEKVLMNLGLADKFENTVLPTVAGFLIFSVGDPQRLRDFSRYVIRCVSFSGDSVSSPIIDKQDIVGSLDQQIDEMQKFILKNIKLKAVISGTKRVEEYEYPEDAIRELVANSVIHRDYMITETYTQVNVFSNRIEISNPGNLPPGVTVANIKDSQFSRNEILAEILKDMDYLEEYGRGIDIVFSRMSEMGLLGPIFKNMSNSFKVILLGEKFKELNERQISIWNLIQEKKVIKSKELRETSSFSRATIANDLATLLSIGLIDQKGSGRDTYYKTKY